MADQAQVTVHPVAPTGGRRVTAHVHGSDSPLGVAHGMSDVAEFLRRAGWLNEEEWPPITWRGGGPAVWGGEPDAEA
ncbi:hypothetical protein ACFYM0_01860 [Streptomyces sp. NPDC006487]|uniref:hypothetical protein n=1 Tax=Streptomyces sp. NPDC006487 TaxID=3364748 RepID=UPI0036C35C6F